MVRVKHRDPESRAFHQRLKMQRYDAMLEQIGIRKAALSQRVLKLKSDESQQQEIIQGHQEKCKEIGAQMDGIQMEYRKVEREVGSLRSQMEEQNKKLEQGQTAYHREASVWSPCEILQNVMKDMATVSGVLWNRRIASRGSTVLLQT